MKIDIILIAYNQERYIAQAVKSIIMQQVDKNVEVRVIVADDCSDDKTLDIIKSYEATSPFPFVYLDNKTNVGHVLNYQRAFSACNGDYIAIIEGDDWWSSTTHIQTHLNYLQEHYECVLTTTTPILYNNNFYSTSHYNTIGDNITIYSTQDFLPTNKIVNLSACVIRHSTLKMITPNVFCADLLDWILYIALSEYGVLVRLKIVTSIYRINTEGYWNKMTLQQQIAYKLKVLTDYDKLLNGKYHNSIENAKLLLENKKSYKKYIKKFIPPIIFHILRLFLPPILLAK